MVIKVLHDEDLTVDDRDDFVDQYCANWSAVHKHRSDN